MRNECQVGVKEASVTEESASLMRALGGGGSVAAPPSAQRKVG